MSKNGNYINQFDKNAGRPDDFDSLFSFENGELNVRRKIRMRKTGGKTAAMLSAAAAVVIVSAVGLTLISTGGLSSDTGIAEKSDAADTTYTAALAESGVAPISEFAGRFDYFLGEAELITAGAETDYIYQPDIYMYVNVASKTAESGEIIYTVFPESYYISSEMMNSVELGYDDIKISSDCFGAEELQAGSEYFIAVAVENDKLVLCTGEDSAARKTDSGWLVKDDSPFAGDGMPVYNDMEHITGYEAKYVLVSDDDFGTAVQEILGESGRNLRYYSFGMPEYTDSGSISVFNIFEGIDEKLTGFLENADGGYDHCVLNFRPDDNHEITAHLYGEVIYSGVNAKGENTVVLSLDYGDCYTAVFCGFDAVNAVQGEKVEIGSVLGTANDNGVYCQVYSDGVPVQFLPV